MDTARTKTLCRVYMHPACTDRHRPFEVRRMAREEGAIFVSVTRRSMRTPTPPNQGPFGGDAA